MYIPSVYKNQNQEEVKRFIQENSFGTLIKHNRCQTPEIRDAAPGEMPDAWPGSMYFKKIEVPIDPDHPEKGMQPLVRQTLIRHLPFELDLDSDHYIDGQEMMSLSTHLGKHYPIYQDISDSPDGDEVMIVFKGPGTYVSPTWYESREAATFNFISIQVYGKVRKLADEELKGVLSAQLYKYEKRFRTDPNLSLSMIEKRFEYLKRFIGAIRVQIESWDAVYKLSQDRSEWDLDNIQEHLKASGYRESIAIAEEMERRRDLIRRGEV